MIPGRIPRATRYLGAPVGWVPDEHGDCAHLAIRDMPVSGGVPAMHSVWEPTPLELERLNAGGKVYLVIIGTVHPPVSLAVGMPPSLETPDDEP
jgi:hypothetical protein